MQTIFTVYNKKSIYGLADTFRSSEFFAENEKKKICIFVLNCHRHMVQPLVLLISMCSFQKYQNWKFSVPKGGTCPPIERLMPTFTKFFILCVYCYYKKMLKILKTNHLHLYEILSYVVMLKETIIWKSS